MIIIILLSILLLFLLNNENFFNIGFNDTIYDNDDFDVINSPISTRLLNDYKLSNDFNCYIYGCNSSRNDMIKWIGTDTNKNNIFTDNTNYYLYNNDILNKIDNYDDTNVIKYNNIINIPLVNQDNKLKLKIKLSYLDYTFNGYLTNNFYNIQYLLYYKPLDIQVTNDMLYEYIAVKIIDKEYKIIHIIPPRTKIENLEIIWINYGSIILGPLIHSTTI